MLEVRDLHFSYGRSDVLRGITLTHERGVGCVLGPNGAGKTTLLKCVLGLFKPRVGKVLLDGRDVLSMDYVSRAKLMSYVPQELNLRFPYVALEVVLMGRTPHLNLLLGPSRTDEEEAWRAMRLLGIDHLASRPFTSLSGGEKRLILIARAIAQGSKLMLLDEPTSFLDFRNKHVVLDLVRRVASEGGRLVLMTLHDPNLACMYCDKVFLMGGGTVIKSGPPEEVVTENTMLEVYGLRVKVLRADGHRLVVPEKHPRPLSRA